MCEKKAGYGRYNYDQKLQKEKADCKVSLIDKRKLAASIGISLFSHPVAGALSSAPLSLTSVFGMGTGGPSASSTPIKLQRVYGSPNWARTSDIMINSHALSADRSRVK